MTLKETIARNYWKSKLSEMSTSAPNASKVIKSLLESNSVSARKALMEMSLVLREEEDTAKNIIKKEDVASDMKEGGKNFEKAKEGVEKVSGAAEAASASGKPDADAKAAAESSKSYIMDNIKSLPFLIKENVVKLYNWIKASVKKNWILYVIGLIFISGIVAYYINDKIGFWIVVSALVMAAGYGIYKAAKWFTAPHTEIYNRKEAAKSEKEAKAEEKKKEATGWLI